MFSTKPIVSNAPAVVILLLSITSIADARFKRATGIITSSTTTPLPTSLTFAYGSVSSCPTQVTVTVTITATVPTSDSGTSSISSIATDGAGSGSPAVSTTDNTITSPILTSTTSMPSISSPSASPTMIAASIIIPSGGIAPLNSSFYPNIGNLTLSSKCGSDVWYFLVDARTPNSTWERLDATGVIIPFTDFRKFSGGTLPVTFSFSSDPTIPVNASLFQMTWDSDAGKVAYNIREVDGVATDNFRANGTLAWPDHPSTAGEFPDCTEIHCPAGISPCPDAYSTGDPLGKSSAQPYGSKAKWCPDSVNLFYQVCSDIFPGSPGY